MFSSRIHRVWDHAAIFAWKARPNPVVRLGIQWSSSGGQGTTTASDSGVQWPLEESHCQLQWRPVAR